LAQFLLKTHLIIKADQIARAKITDMNPANPSSPLVQDVAVPSIVPTQPAIALAGSLTPSLVGNIPVKMPDTPSAVPLKEDGELDEIMRDVTHELKREDPKPYKKRFGLFSGKTKPPQVKAPNPIPKSQPTQSKPTAPPPAQTKSAPLLAITLAVLVTGALIAAAYYSYR
jgi:hypothetical protein